ncbi:hypothetical protein ABH935_005840 [Catenulispora sp. GAS73]|uniref:hypothetical protein n=1 Tax=Catenulispora sp. GAS73 TaxID=3156269 RepID=UPI003516BF7A
MSDAADDPRFMLQTAILGFHQARVRFQEHGADALPERVVIPLAEAMWWAVSIDEGFTELCAADYEKLSGETGALVLRGARYARNRLGHQRALAVESVNGITPPFTPPVRMFEFVLRPAATLPAPGRPDPHGLANYERYLSGMPARQTLDTCAAWFETCRNKLHSQVGFTWPASP